MSLKRECSNEMNLTANDKGGGDTEERGGGGANGVPEGKIAIKSEPEAAATSNIAATAASNRTAAPPPPPPPAAVITKRPAAATLTTTGSSTNTTKTAGQGATKKTKTTVTSSGGNNASKAQAATTNAATSTTATTTSSSPNKKRPYIRTKRPAGYNDKSSITTATDTLWQSPLNVYDAVLSEASDLLQAATEAQQLGRLKMASAYLLLLHARLVGLGKRFDKAYSPVSSSSLSRALGSATSAATSSRQSGGGGGGGGASPQVPHYSHASTTTSAGRCWNGGGGGGGPPTGGGSAPFATMDGSYNHHDNKTAALASLLPSHIELDTAMMEHLARAAAELHAARCSGRSQQSGGAGATTLLPSPMRDSGAIGTSNNAPAPSTSTHSTLPMQPPPLAHHHSAEHPQASPHKRPALHSPNAREFLQSTANHRGVTNAATAATGVAAAPPQQQPQDSWPPQNHPAMDGPQRQTTAIGTSLQSHRQQMQDNDHTRSSTTAIATTPTTTVQTSSPPKSTTPVVTTGMNWSGPRAKPVTAAMNTVPHAQCNVRDLLLLPRQQRANHTANSSGTRTNAAAAAPLLAPPPRDQTTAPPPVPPPPKTVARTL
jgi:hypothetical protein